MLPSQKPFRGTQLNRTHPLAKGLVGCWLLNEATGETVFDLSGNNNHGELKNGVAWKPSKFGGGLEFDGVDDYVIVPYDSSLEPNYITISAWIKPQTGARYIISNWIAIDDSSFIIQLYEDDLQSNVVIDDGHQQGSAVSITLNEWHYVAMIYDGDRMKTYLDGVLSADNDVVNGTLPTDGLDVYIGNRAAGDRAFNGSIDSVRIYNRALSAEEVAWSYREPYAMFEPAFNPALLYSAAPPVGAVMNQFQRANIGADLYNGVFA